MVRAAIAAPPPLTVGLTVKYSLLLTTSLKPSLSIYMSIHAKLLTQSQDLDQTSASKPQTSEQESEQISNHK